MAALPQKKSEHAQSLGLQQIIWRAKGREVQERTRATGMNDEESVRLSPFRFGTRTGNSQFQHRLWEKDTKMMMMTIIKPKFIPYNKYIVSMEIDRSESLVPSGLSVLLHTQQQKE